MKKSLNFGIVKPTFMIIGVQKGGTTSLNYYLSQHPQIILPKEKELHYFDTAAATPTKPYLEMFPKSFFTRKVSYDATPNYIYYPGTAKKIYDFDPKIKFIVLIRDPVKRAFSAWNMHRQMVTDPLRKEAARKIQKNDPMIKTYNYFYSNEFPSFSEWVDFELGNEFPQGIIEPSIIKRGYYLKQIQEYLKYFPRKNFLFIDFEIFKMQTLKSLDDITDFLKISHFDKEGLDITPKNKRAYSEKISEEVYKKLIEHFKMKNKGLEKLTGLKLDWMH
jgi:hypothetical protein